MPCAGVMLRSSQKNCLFAGTFVARSACGLRWRAERRRNAPLPCVCNRAVCFGVTAVAEPFSLLYARLPTAPREGYRFPWGRTHLVPG